MQRFVVGLVTLAALVGAVASSQAEAQRRRRGPRAAPRSAAIAPALGDIRWGMTNRQVFGHFRGKIEERYRDRLAEIRDAVEEDRLRHEMAQEIQRVRRSYIRFNGQTTGWDVSFLRDEFTHNNNESMLVVRDGNSQNFYFFINDRLWKWYKAFDARVFQGQEFGQFASALQGRFGRALERSGRMTDRGDEKRWLEWQDNNTRLRAIDENQFYGFYCLVFEEKSTLGRLSDLRINRATSGERGHALVEAVTQDSSEASSANQDIVDRITGRIRRRTDAPADNARGASRSDSSMGSSSGTSRPSRSESRSDLDDDPLRGLDL